MAFKARGKGLKGLDDGPQPKSKKSRKTTANDAEGVAPTDTVNSEAQPAPIPKIQPGEKMWEFSQRVNQALPLAGVQKKGKNIGGSNDHRVTKHEKKLKRLQKGWREEEARIRDKEDEVRELAEEEQDELDAMWEDKTADLPVSGKTKKGKRKMVVGEVIPKEDDPWEALQKKRGGPIGMHDVVQAPPTFDRVPREIFKVKNGAKVNVGNVPKMAGSLRKREELGEERLTIIDTYRKLMAAQRNGEKE
jgi:hypothetical protein